MLWCNKDHGQVWDVHQVRDVYLVGSSLIVIDADVKRAPTNNAETARHALALCPALLLVLCIVRLVRRYACGCSRADSEPEGVGI